MTEWLKSLKISIAGARLSHLVQQDKIWDHGSMTEQVRTVFILLKKAFHRNAPEIIKKCLTESLFAQMEKRIQDMSPDQNLINNELEQVNIIGVTRGKNGQHDKFTASLKFKQNNSGYNIQQWLFVRNGDWWLLDEVRIKKHMQYF